ncbi:hypothetical protein ACF0H5_015863 [Mactra antiquata]
MLSDAQFTSPWSSDVLITGDFKLPIIDDSDGDEDIQGLYNSYQYAYDVDNHSYLGSISGSSCMTTSSDCSTDDLYVDGDDDGFLLNIEASTSMQGLDDLIDSTVMNDNNVISDVLSLEKDNNMSSLVTIPEASYAFTCSTRLSSKHCSACRRNKTPCKKWSHMSKSEKAKMVDELSLTISRELGLREQMDIIKIIDPAASFDKKPSEFVIDLNSIDDSKLEKIQDVVNTHCIHSPDINDNHKKQEKKFTKKSKSSDRKPRVAKQRSQKEYRQKLKEKRSGLFVKEERLAVSTMTIEEDIDIVG